MRRHLAIGLASLLLAALSAGARAEGPPPAEPKTSPPVEKPAEAKPKADPPVTPKEEPAPKPREEAAPKPPDAAPKPPEKAEAPSKPEVAEPKPVEPKVTEPKAAEPKAPPAPKAREASPLPRTESPVKDAKREPTKTGSTTRPGDEKAAPKRTKAAVPSDDGAGKTPSQPKRRAGARTPPVDTERPPVMVVCDETRNDNGLRFIIHTPGPTGVRLSLSDKGGKEIERDLIASSDNIAHARIIWGLRNYPAERMLRGTFLIAAGDRNRALSGVMLGYDGAGSLLSFAASLTRNDEDPRRWALSLGQERRFNCREPRGEPEAAAVRQPDGSRGQTREGGSATEERPRRRPAREAREPRQSTTP